MRNHRFTHSNHPRTCLTYQLPGIQETAAAHQIIQSTLMPLLERPNKPPIFYQLDDYTDPWKNAPAVLLQHGFGRSSQFWYSWVPYLSRYYKVLRPDLRGCGNSAAGLIPEQDISLD